MTCLVTKRLLKVSCCIDITQKQNRWSKPAPPPPVIHFELEWVVFCCAIIPRGQQEFPALLTHGKCHLTVMNSQHCAPRTRTCRSRRWALPCLSSNQITQISLCVLSVCPFIWALSCSWICSDWRIYQAQRSQNNTGRFARLKCNSHSVEDKRMQMVGYVFSRISITQTWRVRISPKCI